MERIKGVEVDEFTAAYLAAAFFSTNDESTPSGGVPLDNNYSPENLADATFRQALLDCQRFQEENAQDIATWGQAEYWKDKTPESTPAAQAGYDFWMTRNGHGVGFWEDEWGEPGTRLDAASQQYPEVNLIVGDSGQIW
jgi:hypothetical protein